MTITVNVADALSKIDVFARKTSDYRPVLQGEVNASVNEFFVNMFAGEGANTGAKWAPLAPITVLLRKRAGHGRGGILRDTNRLWASLTKLGLGPEALRAITPTSLERGTLVPYARWINAGYTSKTFVAIGADGLPVPLRRKVPKLIAPRRLIPEITPGIVGAWEKFITGFVLGDNPSAA